MLIKKEYETSISGFEAWSGAVETQDLIVLHEKEDEFEALIEELYPDGIDETTLNDLLWFEDDWIIEVLGIKDEDDEETDDTEEEE